MKGLANAIIGQAGAIENNARKMQEMTITDQSHNVADQLGYIAAVKK